VIDNNFWFEVESTSIFEAWHSSSHLPLQNLFGLGARGILMELCEQQLIFFVANSMGKLLEALKMS
jgi:hypothetical protein